jgi:hypothetical protein
MTSAARIEANRRNARRSTGPRTPEGKARSSRNAFRHGLNRLAAGDPAWRGRIDALARVIAGPEATAERLWLAWAIAAAHIDVVRVRRARCELWPADLLAPRAIQKLAAFSRYEGRALARRNAAMDLFDAADDAYSGWRNEPMAEDGETNPTRGASGLAQGVKSRPCRPACPRQARAGAARFRDRAVVVRGSVETASAPSSLPRASKRVRCPAPAPAPLRKHSTSPPTVSALAGVSCIFGRTRGPPLGQALQAKPGLRDRLSDGKASKTCPEFR